jgi:hypothetical protein
MGSSPDVRLRLSAEGELSIINAFKRIQAQAETTGRVGSRGLGALTSAASTLGRLLPTLTFGAAIAGAVVLARRALETADNFFKLSQKTGVNVETLSAYAHGADLAGIDTETLAKALGRLAKNTDLAAHGGAEAARPFRELGIEFRNQQGALRPLDALLGDIADRFAGMEDGTRKTALAIELFGRSGANLIPFLNKGRTGLAEIRAEAERLGLVLSTEDARAAEEFNDNLKRLRETVDGFARRELVAVLPLLIQFSKWLLEASASADKAGDAQITLGQRALLGIGMWAAAAKAFATGGGFAGIMGGQTFGFSKVFQEELDKIDAIIFKRLREPPAPGKPNLPPGPPVTDEAAHGKALDATKRFLDAQLALTRAQLDSELALAKAQSAATATIDQDRFKAGLTGLETYFAARRAALESEAANEISILEKEAKEIKKRVFEAATRPLKPLEPAVDRETEVRKLHADLAKVETEAKVRGIALTGDRARLEGEERDAVRTFNTEQLNGEAQILNAQGQRFAAARVELEAEIAGMKRLAGEEDAAFAKRKMDRQEAGEAQIRFEEVQAKARQSLSELESSRIQIETLVTRGVITEREGQVAIAQLEKNRLPVLEEIAVAMKAAAVTPEQIEAARQFADQLEQLAASSDLAGQRMAQFKNAVDQALTSDLANFFSRGIDEATSFGDAMRRLAASVVQSLREIASQMLANMIIQAAMSAFSGAAGFSIGGVGAGAPVAGAGGGLVRGPGTGTSDSIPARLSDQEYVVRAAVVREPGVLSILETLNEGGIEEFRQAIENFYTMQIRPMPRAHNYARGGLVVDGEPGQAAGRGQIEAEFAVDEGVILRRFKGSKEFERLVLRVLGNNPRTVKGLLGR